MVWGHPQIDGSGWIVPWRIAGKMDRNAFVRNLERKERPTFGRDRNREERNPDMIFFARASLEGTIRNHDAQKNL
jgi:hypothetical protein